MCFLPMVITASTLTIDPTVRYFGWANFPLCSDSSCSHYCLDSDSTAAPLSLSFEIIPDLSEQPPLAVLHLADTFQGCCKNRTNGTRDYRWFAGLHLLMRFVVVCFLNLSNYYKINAVLMVISLSFYMGLLAILQPYKNSSLWSAVHLSLYG